MEEKTTYKNVKISEKHHQLLKSYCDKHGYKIHKVIEKWIDDINKTKKREKDLYDE
jgi:coproporphyrinogen III oxidase